MAFGITPARGPWEYRRSAITTLSQGQFQKGDAVGLDKTRLASLLTSSNYSSLFGIAMHDSLNSMPVGYVTIAIPTPQCTAYMDLLTTEAASGMSFGQSGSIVSAAGHTSTFSLLATSVWSRMVTIVGPVDSNLSRVEVSFIQNASVVYSTSSNTYT